MFWWQATCLFMIIYFYIHKFLLACIFFQLLFLWKQLCTLSSVQLYLLNSGKICGIPSLCLYSLFHWKKNWHIDIGYQDFRPKKKISMYNFFTAYIAKVFSARLQICCAEIKNVQYVDIHHQVKTTEKRFVFDKKRSVSFCCFVVCLI